MKDGTYFLGCPVWACNHWQGSLFTRDARRDQWVDGTLEPFHFVLKFPRAISHDHRLLNAEAETDQFLQVLQILKDTDRLGPAFLQLPSGFAPHQLDDLAGYLQSLPTEFPYAVEVRYHDFFDKGPNERALNRLLRDLKIDCVIFDSRPLFSAPPDDDYERLAQTRIHDFRRDCEIRAVVRLLINRDGQARIGGRRRGSVFVSEPRRLSRDCFQHPIPELQLFPGRAVRSGSRLRPDRGR